LEKVEDFVEPLEKNINKHLKDPVAKEASTSTSGPSSSAKSSNDTSAPPPPSVIDTERSLEQGRSTLSIVMAMHGQVDDIQQNRKFQEFFIRIQRKPLVAELLAETKFEI
jgi:hypothetical protein